MREGARLSVKAAAAALEWSTPKIWRIETGQVSMRTLDVRNMCEIYGASSEMTEVLMGLAKETKAKGWWHAYGASIPEGFDLYVGLEEATSHMDAYHDEIVLGLFQTEGYARAIIRAHLKNISEDELDTRVRLRMARQAILTRVTAPITFRAVLSETILLRCIGGPAVMAHQLAHLVYMAELGNISLRVVPLAAGVHDGVMTGPFNILRFPVTGDGRETEPPTIYIDGHTGGLYLDKPSEVEQYDAAFQNIWETALSVFQPGWCGPALGWGWGPDRGEAPGR
ncbi:helix-turn-helix domain-containing protein [Streptomyces radicis]|uniref:XRE family transcriptional regulator n=1 Tax=Streptomyces radicis TaxID=1750517 RepID=A0A3A9VWK9_9ACTN|nr:helix-turn-helix transcriptional regulator [Streptomyces radicis]RKN05405.1 XRE family transcriptional regulator [Streptomyces radicis]RKN16913.1 XRE family transcriptional regulator [Streptomyces radicis]